MKVYLGDAVYSIIDEYSSLVLTTEDGYSATNTIILENETLESLFEFLRRNYNLEIKMKES